MKERQRWQPEEDALLRAYVKQYGAKEWNLVSQRMGNPLRRDAKSCLERWKNYLKPGIKKGSLTQEEQALVISLQAKYGNKWKKIAAEVPGRTAKRLGKWWEVFKEKQSKEKRRHHHHHHQPASLEPSSSSSSAAAAVAPPHSQYDHILDTFAEKYVQPKLNQHQHRHLRQTVIMQNIGIVADLSLGGGATPASEIQGAPPLSSPALPSWLSSSHKANKATCSSSSTVSPSVSLTLSSPSDPGLTETTPDVGSNRLMLPVNQVSALVQCCREMEEGRQSWVQHKKEATWRLSRLEQQLESEKARKKREKIEEVEAKIRGLRDEERAFLERIDGECREQLIAIQRDADAKEAKMLEMWAAKHLKLSKLLEHIPALHHHHLNVSN